MSPKLALLALPLIALIAPTTVSTASTPDFGYSFAVIDSAAVGAGLTVAPDGSWAPFTEAYSPTGALVDATITLTLLDNDELPIENYPAADIWLETTLGGLVSCFGGSSPDSDTDENGQTRWVEPLHAGGCSVGETTVVFVAGSPLDSSPIELIFRSFDFNADLDVNLSDIVIFTQSIGLYHPCADYNNDGTISLVDIVRLTQGLGGNCN